MTSTPEKFIASLPSSRINNSRAIVRDIYEKAKRNGKFGGYWVDKFEEISGIQRADEETTFEPANN